MSARFVRSPNNFVLIAAGIALLVVALRSGIAAASHYPIPVDRIGGKAVAVAMSCTRDAIFGTALLIVAFRRSRFAGATAVIVATFLVFVIVVEHVTLLAFVGSARLTWWTAFYLAIAGSLIGSSLSPWNSTAKKPVFFWIALTVVSMTFLVGTLAILARL
jgi:hypothetical protein